MEEKASILYNQSPKFWSEIQEKRRLLKLYHVPHPLRKKKYKSLPQIYIGLLRCCLLVQRVLSSQLIMIIDWRWMLGLVLLKRTIGVLKKTDLSLKGYPNALWSVNHDFIICHIKSNIVLLSQRGMLPERLNSRQERFWNKKTNAHALWNCIGDFLVYVSK